MVLSNFSQNIWYTYHSFNKPSEAYVVITYILSGKNKPDCDHCLDNPRKKCKHCACCECGGKEDPDKQILCDECDQAYHLACLKPPLTSIPEDDEW